MVMRTGTSFGLSLSGANRRDSLMLALTLDAVPPVRHGRDRSRCRPDKLYADKADDHQRCRTGCRGCSITPRISRRGTDCNEQLWRSRWLVERTLAWLNRFRRLTNCYERREDIHLAFTTLECDRICFNQCNRSCWALLGGCLSLAE
jgi:transposase